MDIIERFRSGALCSEAGGRPCRAIEASAGCDCAIAADALDALKACESWIDRWTKHVGNCKGGAECTCGRSAVLFDAAAALNPPR